MPNLNRKNLVIACTLAVASFSAAATNYFLVVPLADRGKYVPGIAVQLNKMTLPRAVLGNAYPPFEFQSLVSITGDPEYAGTGVTWQVLSGALPAGLALSSNGSLSGTPTTGGESTFQVRANYKTHSGQATYKVFVASVTVALAEASAPQARVGAPYAFDLKPLLTVGGDSGYSGTGLTWGITSGSLPAGLTLGQDGLISGTPTVAAQSTVQVSASFLGVSGLQVYQVHSLDIQVSLATAALPGAVFSQAYSYDFKPRLSVSGDPAYVAGVAQFLPVGALPAGLTLSAAGVLSGSPSGVGGAFQVEALYRDVAARQNYTVGVTPGIKNYGSYRGWSDGEVATSCNTYKNPGAGRSYVGATGDGVYSIQPIGSPAPAAVYCDMTTNGGGYTVLVAATAGNSDWTQSHPGSSPPQPGTPSSYLPVELAKRIATGASQIYIREVGSSNAAWTSNATAMNNLRGGFMLGYSAQPNVDQDAQWTFSPAGVTHIRVFNHPTQVGGNPIGGVSYPAVHWGVNDGESLHFTFSGGSGNSTWKFTSAAGAPLMMMVR